MGALTENHRCRRGTVSRVSHALSTVAVGGGLGTVACFAIEDRPAGALLIAPKAKTRLAAERAKPIKARGLTKANREVYAVFIEFFFFLCC